MFCCGWCECVSGEIEKQRFGRFGRGERERASLLGARAVPGRQRDSVERKRAFGDLQPRAAPRLEFVRDPLAGLEANAINLSILMNCR